MVTVVVREWRRTRLSIVRPSAAARSTPPENASSLLLLRLLLFTAAVRIARFKRLSRDLLVEENA